MYEYTSYDSISIKVGQNAKENDELTMTSDPKEWWMHVSGYPGSHVVICYDGETVPKETKRDAAVLAVAVTSAVAVPATEHELSFDEADSIPPPIDRSPALNARPKPNVSLYCAPELPAIPSAFGAHDKYRSIPPTAGV